MSTTEITARITTPSGARITATLAPISRQMSADGWRVSISQDGRTVGQARWVAGQITDIDARLGAADGSETDAAYRSLDSALAAS